MPVYKVIEYLNGGLNNYNITCEWVKIGYLLISCSLVCIIDFDCIEV